MTQDLHCSWCRTPLAPQDASWWDGQPQCSDPHACTRRIPRQTSQEARS